ncbi:hypothetical protein PISMIDRAFT_687144 [Pisolithus microcarpus 441]|uniref:Uncharacterized protein n=1 Tax=Pisolithus microcarpus 441 TaxID=765257 RepID=A0A0C9XTB1_9AGAM|nr:hypothetical protein PISMIDRAFT_687144 [Pisolithus microcarpus 441]
MAASTMPRKGSGFVWGLETSGDLEATREVSKGLATDSKKVEKGFLQLEMARKCK